MYAMIDALGEIYSEPKAIPDHWKHISTAPDMTGGFLCKFGETSLLTHLAQNRTIFPMRCSGGSFRFMLQKV